ncbi:hypothetical protein D3X11_00280 [Streptococcus sp. X16XC17]|nr:hypothetical protein D3X11_00280 [Streptococcus sp. X16XC17]
MFGNTLQLQDISRYNVIIPVNRCFDTVVDNDLISENTLHGKLLKLLYEQGRFTEQCLDEYIQDELYKRGCEFELLDTKKKSKGNLRRYKEGSIVELTVENVNYFLVGFSKFDSDLHASVSQKEYSDSMSAILEYIDKRSQVFLTYLPLIGGGHLSAYADEQVLLDFMLKLFQLNEEKINCNINIVLPEQARSRVSIL